MQEFFKLFSTSHGQVYKKAKGLIPGVLIAAVIAIAAQFLSEHYGAPAMLLALLLGIAFNFLAEEGRCAPGIGFAARTVLRFGVALLGVRVSVDLILNLGAPLVLLILSSVVFTILFALLVAKLLGREWSLALLTGGSVAICGASAAMAIAAVLPQDAQSEKRLTFTVLAVTILSTFAMVVYPVITGLAGLDQVSPGFFLGATIHDVAQVVGAGFSVSDQAGETATTVKLLRVATLAPTVLLLSFILRFTGAGTASSGRRPPLLPGFVAAFLCLAALNSAGVVPKDLSGFLSDVSRWSLVTAISAVGMKTDIRSILNTGGYAVPLIVAETLFLAGYVMFGLHWLQ